METAEREDEADDDPAERLPFGSLLALYPFIQAPDAGDALEPANRAVPPHPLHPPHPLNPVIPPTRPDRRARGAVR